MSTETPSSELPKKETRRESIARIIQGAAEKVEREFADSANDWLSCFGSKIFQIETYLFGAEAEFGPDETEVIKDRLDKLTERLMELKKLYHSKTDIPPEEIKQELFRKLNILG